MRHPCHALRLILRHGAKQFGIPHNSRKDRLIDPSRKSRRQPCRDRLDRPTGARQHPLDYVLRNGTKEAFGCGAVEMTALYVRETVG
jgi:hypothetical protein